MKKIFLLILSLILCVSLCACKDNDAEVFATVTNNEGKTEDVSVKELCELFESNEAKFDRLYEYCPITVESIINNIESDAFYLNETNYASYILHLNGGWDVEILQSVYDKQYSHLDVGDTIIITSKIYNCLTISEIVQISDIHTDGMGNKVDETNIEVID